MDISVYLLLGLAVVSTYEHTPDSSDETLSPCVEDEDEEDVAVVRIMEGEGLCLQAEANLVAANMTEASWYTGDDRELSSSEEERIHHHGPTLLFLPLSLHDSAFYRYGRSSPRRCFLSVTKVTVFPASMVNSTLLMAAPESAGNILISCGTATAKLCQDLGGNLTWYRNFSLIPYKNDATLMVNGATKGDQGIYTCMCTWTHNQNVYNTSYSRRLEVKDPSASHSPLIIMPLHGSVETAVRGSSKTLTCSVYCGRNIQDNCDVWWMKNGQRLRWHKGYNEEHSREDDASTKLSIFKAILTIDSVSVQDFHSELTCWAMNDQRWISALVLVRPEASMLPHTVTWVCVVLLLLLAALTGRYFAVDLVLLFRRVFPSYGRPEDGKVYDAYVLYQSQRVDRATEDRLHHFIHLVLPSVLEQKHGFRLFIQGRDDLPGEDRIELVQTCMQQSRRLMVVLAPGSGSGSGVEGHGSCLTPLEEYDGQVGLHHALLQSEMSVILVQLGPWRPEGLAHLPPAVQHLLRKGAPLRWQEGAQGVTPANSRFWKRLRYRMPAAPLGRRKHPEAHMNRLIDFQLRV